jgi:hypothetical protein
LDKSLSFWYCLIFLRNVGAEFDPTNLLEAAQGFCELEEARCVATLDGKRMLMTEIWTHDGRELAMLILSERIESVEGVKGICPALLQEKLKDQL